MNRKSHYRMKEFKGIIVSFLGRSGKSGLITTLGLVFLLGAALSFYTLSPGEIGIEHGFSMGREGELLFEYVETVEYGNGWKIPGFDVELHWHLPPPIVEDHKIDMTEDQEFSIYTIIGQRHPEGLWEKFMNMLSGPLGTNFNAIKFTIGYSPKEAESWANYDYDSLGPKRLIRDMVDIVDEWKEEKLSDFQDSLTNLSDSDEVNYMYTTFLKELSRKGIIEDYIRNSFSQTSFSTNVFYGTTMERIKPGFDVVLNELDQRQKEYDSDFFLDDSEKEELRKSLDSAKEIVKEALDEIEGQVNLEYSELRRNPLILKGYVQDPYNSLVELRSFETLWWSIQRYILYLYNTEKILDIMTEGEGDVFFVDGSDDHLAQELLNKLQEDPYLNDLIDIKWIRYDVMDIGMSQFQMLMQKWKDLI